jgi:hypothetical protein
MAEYIKLEKQLGKVRRAWKRTAALGGLAIVCLEALGLVTLALLIDWIYLSSPTVRIAIFGAVALAVVVLLVRHVVSPLVRRISDEQLALFVEEHNDKFEGSLITAAELFMKGRDVAGRHGRDARATHGQDAHATAHAAELAAEPATPADMVEAVVQSALARADKLRAASVVDFRRLRKYGVAAIFVLAVYGLMCLTVPGVGRHASRVLAPWQATADDLSGVPLMNRPITFTLSKGDTSVLRGSALDLEAVLSRPTEDPVTLNFRLAGDASAPWRSLAFADAQKHNGFAVTLPDINDETEYFVSSGPYRSDSHKIGVYDALVIGGVEVTTKFPAYMQLPDRVETQQTGDVSAPIGSTVTLRVLTNRPLTGGKLSWQGGGQQDLAVVGGDDKGKASAAASFDVKADASYNFSVFDVTNQRADSSSVSSVRALPDNPPTIEMKYPTGSVLANALGEINFDVDVADDWGLAGADLVYERVQSPSSRAPAGADAGPRRIPLKLTRAATARLYPDVAQATLRFALGELTPPVMPQEIINYYIEASDRKGQKVVTEYKTIVVGNFEDWPTVKAAPPHDPTYLNMKDVREYVQASWKLFCQKEQDKPALPADQYAKGCRELAESMIDPETGAMYAFYDAKHVPEEKQQYINDQLAAAKKALEGSDAAAACKYFRIALAEITFLGLNHTAVPILAGDVDRPRGSSVAMTKSPEELLHTIAIEVGARQPPPGFKPEMAKQAEELRKTALDLKKQEEDIVKKAEEIAKANADAPKKDDAAKEAAALAAKQEALADKAHQESAKASAAADPNAPKPEAKPDDNGKPVDPNAKPRALDPELKTMAGRIEDASQAMKDAAKNMKASTDGDKRMEQAVADAKRAAQELDRAAQKLETVRQEKLAQAIAQVEAQAGKILNDQKDLNKDTEAAGKEPPKPGDASKDKEFKNLAIRQAQLDVNVKAVMTEVEQLHEWSQREGKSETTKHIEDAGNHMTRGEVDQKMTNAVVELTSKHAAQAGAEQHEAVAAMEGAVASMRKASDSMAADREAQLKRAANEARQIEQGLVKLGAEPKAPTAGPASRPAVASNDPAKNDPAKADPTKADPTKTDPTKNDPAKNDPAKNDPGKNDPTKNDPSKNDPLAKTDDKGPQQPLSEQEKKALKEQLSYDMARLAQHLQDRDFAAHEDVNAIQQASGKTEQLGVDKPDDKRKLEDLAALVRRVGDKLETEYETTLQAKKLMAAQREECPPSYRQLVNKYYEALSEAGK